MCVCVIYIYIYIYIMPFLYYRSRRVTVQTLPSLGICGREEMGRVPCRQQNSVLITAAGTFQGKGSRRLEGISVK